MKYCTECGAANKDEAVFCTACGHHLQPAAQPSNASATETIPTPAYAPAPTPKKTTVASVLGGTMFLIFSILMSIVSLIKVIQFNVYMLPITVCTVIITVFCWVLFVSAKASNSTKAIGGISGSLLAAKIVSIVMAVLVIITALGTLILGAALTEVDFLDADDYEELSEMIDLAKDDWDEFTEEYEAEFRELEDAYDEMLEDAEDIPFVTSLFGARDAEEAIILVLEITQLIADNGGVGGLITRFGMYYLVLGVACILFAVGFSICRKYVKDVSMFVGEGAPRSTNGKSAKVWLIIFAVIHFILLFIWPIFSAWSLIRTLCLAGVSAIGFITIGQVDSIN